MHSGRCVQQMSRGCVTRYTLVPDFAAVAYSEDLSRAEQLREQDLLCAPRPERVYRVCCSC